MGLLLSTYNYLLGKGEDMDTPDQATGLTRRQKNAIQDSWELVSADMKGNGVAFLIKFFQDYPEDMAFFAPFKGKKPESLRDNPTLRAHALTVMHALSSIVENLDDPDCLIGLLRKNATNHYKRNVMKQQYKDLFETYIKFLQIALGDKCTELTKESWEKALTVILSVIEAEQTALSNQNSPTGV